MTDLVKAFGCRQAYENRACTNLRGPRHRYMGISSFARLRRWRNWPALALAGTWRVRFFATRTEDRELATAHIGPVTLILAKGAPRGLSLRRGVLRREVSASRAGSRRAAPGWCGRVGWHAWFPPSPEGLDDRHAPAAAEGQGGSESSGSGTSSGSGGGATASSSRAPMILTFRAELASKP
jgi:hypothetical protein